MGPIYSQPEFLIWFRYDNTGTEDLAVLEGADAAQAIGRLRWHACPLPLTILSVEPWTEDQPLPGEDTASARSHDVTGRSSSRAVCFRVPAPRSTPAAPPSGDNVLN